MMKKSKGYAITVRIEEDYAMSFLAIFNTVRENKELLQVKNYMASDNVTVICLESQRHRITSYLKQFGTLIDESYILCVPIEEEDFDCYTYDDVCYYVAD